MTSKRIASLQKYRSRPPNGLFEALPFEARQRALWWLGHLMQALGQRSSGLALCHPGWAGEAQTERERLKPLCVVFGFWTAWRLVGLIQ